MPTSIDLGALMSALYQEFSALYGDGELAAVATAAAINEIIAEQRVQNLDLDSAA